MGNSRYWLVLFWYVLPFLYLILIEGVFLSNTALVLMTFIVSLTVGYFSFSRVQFQKEFRASLLFDKLCKLIFWLTVLVQLYGFYRVVIDGFELARYRMDFFEASGGVFKSTYLFTLYTVFLMPLFLISIMYWINRDLSIKRNKRLVLYALLVIVLDGVLSLGRFQYLYVLFFFYISYKAFGLRRIFLIISFFSVVIISFLTIYLRQFFVDAAVDSAVDIVNTEVARTSIISYQYDGYVFLDKLIADKSIVGHPWEMNTGNFAFLFLKTITTKFGINFNYPWEQYNLILTEGMYHQKLDIFFNAFATNFLPVYLDLGYFGIFLYGLFSGFFLGVKTNNRLLRTAQYLNLFTLIFGLYQPIITTLIGFVLQIFFISAGLYFLKAIYSYRREKKRIRLNLIVN